MNESKLLERITFNPQIFGSKPIIHGRRLVVEHDLGMLAAVFRRGTVVSVCRLTEIA